MFSRKNAANANALVGKTARACEGCVKKRARCYCPADDTFLCHSSLHSADPLARRHDKVRLNTTAATSSRTKRVRARESNSSSPLGTWHESFVKKPRTPRNRKAADVAPGSPFNVVPEVGGDENSNDGDELLLYRVPAYDPCVNAEMCSSKDGDWMMRDLIGDSSGIDSFCGEHPDLGNLHGFLPTDEGLAEFAAGMESLLGRGTEDQCFGIQELGFMNYEEGNLGDDKECRSLSCGGEAGIKLEYKETGIVDEVRDREMDATNGTFELTFGYGTPTTCCEDEDDKRTIELEDIHDTKAIGGAGGYDNDTNNERKMILRLDYEGIITAWDGRGSPWANGDRPEFDPDDQYWMGLCEPGYRNSLLGEGGLNGNAGREAKVSRYREKRRTRLYSKKIRYEVRKLNAEKRPRMKGRFVKKGSPLAS